MKSCTKKLQLKTEEHKIILDDYLTLDEFQRLSALTISLKRITIISLLNYLTEQKIIDVRKCQQKHVTGYLTSLAHLSSSSISGRTFILRHFFNYLHAQEITPYSGNELFPVIFTNKHEKIISFYSDDEVRSVIRAVDRRSAYGVRDLVIVLLAAELGMRSGDIVRLTLDCIHWERNTIEFIQHKTGVFNQLPLSEHTKYALLDYSA